MCLMKPRKMSQVMDSKYLPFKDFCLPKLLQGFQLWLRKGGLVVLGVFFVWLVSFQRTKPLEKQMAELDHMLLPCTFGWKMFPGNRALPLCRERSGENFRKGVLLSRAWLSASLTWECRGGSGAG